MAIKLQRLNVNLIPNTVCPVAYASQYDAGRKYEFVVYDGAAQAVFPEGTVVQVRGSKPDRTGFAYECELEDNVATIEMPTQAFLVAGEFECELIFLYDANWDTVIGTCNFILSVEPTALGIIRDYSHTEIPAILVQIKKYLDKVTAPFTGASSTRDGSQGTVPAPTAGQQDFVLRGNGDWTSESVILNTLKSSTEDPQDADYYIAQVAGGGTNNTTYVRRTHAALWDFIKNKISSILGLTKDQYGGNAASATKLKTARSFQTNLESTTAVAFDGTADNTHGVTGTLPITNGGTGATTAADARTNLGCEAYHTVLTGTLAAGSTSLSFTDSVIGSNSIFDIYTSSYGAYPTAVSQSGTTVTMTFDAQSAALQVKLEINNK